MSLLAVRSLSKSFGGLRAVDGVDLEVEAGEIVGVIGPNGAGKTTLFALIAGSLAPTAGEIFLGGLGGRRLGPPAHRVVRLGVVRTHQIVRPFANLTVRENVTVAALHAGGRGSGHAPARAAAALELVGLADRAERLPGTLTLAGRKRLELARAVATAPRVLLLDEVVAGVSPVEAQELAALIRRIRDERGAAIVMIEHVMPAVMKLSERVVVLDRGRKIAEGTPEEVVRHPQVLAAYLGPGGGFVTLLAVEAIDVFYGDVQVLYGLSLDVAEGEIVTLLGSNGAGKTTTLRAVSGLARPRAGDIRFRGRLLLALPAAARAELGIALVPEGRDLWHQLTVRENLELGAYNPRVRRRLGDNLARVHALFPRLAERGRQLAGSLSGGEQQMCAIGRALMSEPALLMLDEPSLGLAPIIVDQVMRTLVELHRGGMTILLVEQNLKKALEIAQRGTVIETGRARLAGPCAELRSNPEIRAAYLGI